VRSPGPIALSGALFLCACFLPGRRLLALSAALIGAFLYWAVSFEPDRLGDQFATGNPHVERRGDHGGLLDPLLKWAAADGFLLGATIYTYLASRFWPLVLVLWVIYLLLWHRASLRTRLAKRAGSRRRGRIDRSAARALFLSNQQAFFGRAGQVVQLDSLATNLLRTAGMFFIAGDTDPRDNLPVARRSILCSPSCSWSDWSSPCGVSHKPSYALLLIWFVVMSVPSGLTEAAPNFRRALGALPAVVLMCALGVEWLWGLRTRLNRRV